MDMLSSGLPEQVADEENPARFLTSNSQFNSKGVKHNVLLPEPEAQETSVFRHGREPREALWAIGREQDRAFEGDHRQRGIESDRLWRDRERLNAEC